MSELNDRVKQYKTYTDWGIEPDDAAAKVGIDREEADYILANAPEVSPEEMEQAAQADSAATQAILDPAMTYDGDDYYSLSEFYRERVPDPVGFVQHESALEQTDFGAKGWKRVLDIGMKMLHNIGGTYTMPQSALFHAALGQDVRHAVPPYLAPDEWDNDPEKAFKFVSFADVVVANRLMGEQSDMLLPYTTNAMLMTAEEREAAGFSTGVSYALDVVASGIMDTISDPMTPVSLGSAGKNLFSFLRRKAPVGVQAAALSNIAQQSKGFVELAEAATALGKVRKHVASAVADGTMTRDFGTKAFRKATAAKNLVEAELATRTAVAGSDEIIAESLPLIRPQQIDIPKAKGIARDIALDRKAAAEDGWTEVIRPNPTHMDEAALRNYIVTGADQGSQLGEAIGRIAAGIEDADLTVHTRQHLNPVRSSTHVDFMGQGVDGRVLNTRKELQAVISSVEKRQDALLRDIDSLTEAMGSLEKGSDAAKATKAEIAATTKSVKRMQRDIKFMQKNGRFPDISASASPSGKRTRRLLPSGARRELLDASDFAEDQYGKHWHDFVQRALFPKSYVPRPKLLLHSDPVLRETIRVFDKYAPAASNRITGAMRDADIDITRKVAALDAVLTEAGILTRKGKGAMVQDTFGLKGIGRKIGRDKSRGEQLFDLLDLDHTTDDWASLAADAPDELVRAHNVIRSMFDEDFVRLGLPPEKRITGYITHLIDKDYFADGAMPHLLDGISVKMGVPGFMKSRKGDTAIFSKDITSILDFYSRAVAHELFMRPMYKDVQLAVKDAIRASGKGREMDSLNKFAGLAIENLQGKPSGLRQIAQKLDMTEGHVASDMAGYIPRAAGMLTHASALAGSLRYHVMSMIQAINTSGARFGPFNALKGMAKISTPAGWKAAQMAGIADDVDGLLEGFGSVLSKVAAETRLFAPSIRDTESAIRGVTLFASIGEGMKRLGIDDVAKLTPNQMYELTAEGVRRARKDNHMFGSMGKPVLFNRGSKSVSSIATQFFSFPFKQTETIVDMAMDNPGMFFDYIMQAGFISKLADKAFIDVDPYVGLGYTRDPFGGGGEVIPMSMPVQVLAKYITAMHAVTSDDVSAVDRRKAVHDAKGTWKDLTPFYTSASRLNTVRKVIQGKEVRYTTSAPNEALRREANLSLHPTSDGTTTELPAIFTQMRSREQKLQEQVYDKVQEITREKEGLVLEIIKEFEDSATRGEDDFSPEKISRLNAELRELGFPVTPERLIRIRKDTQQAHDLTTNVRRVLQDKRLGHAAYREYEALQGR